MWEGSHDQVKASCGGTDRAIFPYFIKINVIRINEIHYTLTILVEFEVKTKQPQAPERLISHNHYKYYTTLELWCTYCRLNLQGSGPGRASKSPIKATWSLLCTAATNV